MGYIIYIFQLIIYQFVKKIWASSIGTAVDGKDVELQVAGRIIDGLSA